MNNLKLAVYGATGEIGTPLTYRLLTLGYEVVSFSKSDRGLENFYDPSRQVIIGDVLNFDTVLDSLEGVDVVFCTLGGQAKERIRSLGTQNIVKAMELLGINRLICLSKLGVDESKGNLNLFRRFLINGWLKKDLYNEHFLQEKIIKSSKLDYTIIRAANVVGNDYTGEYLHGFDSHFRNIKHEISRGDVAHFMIKQLFSDAYIRKTTAISY